MRFVMSENQLYNHMMLEGSFMKQIQDDEEADLKIREYASTIENACMNIAVIILEKFKKEI